MRLIRMNKRSRYHGQECWHCHKQVKDESVACASTIFVTIFTDGQMPDSSASMWSYTRRAAKRPYRFPPRTYKEWKFPVVYHRKCIEKILADGLLDPEVEKSMFEEYREQLAEHFEELVDVDWT